MLILLLIAHHGFSLVRHLLCVFSVCLHHHQRDWDVIKRLYELGGRLEECVMQPLAAAASLFKFTQWNKEALLSLQLIGRTLTYLASSAHGGGERWTATVMAFTTHFALDAHSISPFPPFIGQHNFSSSSVLPLSLCPLYLPFSTLDMKDTNLFIILKHHLECDANLIIC